MALIYNFKKVFLPQDPTGSGHFKFNNYYKFNFIFKNDSRESLADLELRISFHGSSVVEKAYVGHHQSNAVLDNNAVFVKVKYLNTSERLNIDLFVSNVLDRDEFEIGINTSQLKVSLSRTLRIKNRILISSRRRRIIFKAIGGVLFSAVTMGSPWWWPLVSFNNTKSTEEEIIDQSKFLRDSLKTDTSAFENTKDSGEGN